MLSVAEVCKQEKHLNFGAGLCGDTWVYAWVHKRGALDKGSSDGGLDLVVMAHGAFPQVVISGAKSLSTPSFNADGRFIVAKNGKEAVVGDSPKSLQVRTWLTLPAGETFEGPPTWAGDDVLFATSGGAPKRSRLYAIAAPAEDAAADPAVDTRRLLFTAEHGGGLMSWDRSPFTPQVLVVHRLANAMLAELVLATAMAGGEAHAPRVIARDVRVEYCKPQAAFLKDGRVVARLNLARGEAGEVTHGLWLLGPMDAPGSWQPAKLGSSLSSLLGEHGSYDVCSSSYAGAHGVREGFVLDASRESIALTVRSHMPQSGMHDELVVVPTRVLGTDRDEAVPRVRAGVGCHVPVALAGGSLVFHYRSPTEMGDLWSTELGSGDPARLTHTMSAAASPTGASRRHSPPRRL